jgi:hypothetical protein
MTEQERIQQLEFLLEMAIDKLIGITGVKDYPDFILRYHLSQSNATSLMDEVSAIETVIREGTVITGNEILNRLGKFSVFGQSPVVFVREALEILSPEILLKIWHS